MKIIVANKDRTSDMGAEIRQSASALQHGRCVPEFISPEISALCLLKAKSEDDYLREFVRILRYRDAVDTLDFDIPKKPGLFGLILAKLKVFLWKLLRYQHDRIAFRQNLINGTLTSALEFESACREKETAELKKRIEALETLVKERET